jgi:glycine/D-amino acid oxidase-like deaminating enzyme
MAATAAEPAKAPINLDIGTPTVVIVKHSLAQRTSRLVRFYESGEIGLGADGLIYLRDSSKMTLAKRQIAEKLIDNENQERRALIQALADSNHRRNDEAEVWELQRARWQQQWKSGWWLRDARRLEPQTLNPSLPEGLSAGIAQTQRYFW